MYNLIINQYIKLIKTSKNHWNYQEYLKESTAFCNFWIYFETKSHYVSLTGLELCKSGWPGDLLTCLPSTRIKGMFQHTQLYCNFFVFRFILCIWVFHGLYAKRGYQIPLQDGCEPRYGFWKLNLMTSGRAATALNSWAIHLSSNLKAFQPFLFCFV